MGDARALAAAVKEQIGSLGGAFMISREAKAFSQETGLEGWAPYLRGRCGVLGEVDADVVASAAGFFPVEVVRAAWNSGRPGVPADRAAHRYAQVCQDFGRRKLAGFGEADRLAELLDGVVADAGPVGAPLFAGWRAMPLPDDGPARVLQLAHVLRELRGGMHITAVLASGLTPLQAMLVGGSQIIPDGEASARYFGWTGPFPALSDEVRQGRFRAERLTDELVAPAFASLTEAAGAELVALLDRARNVALSGPLRAPGGAGG